MCQLVCVTTKKQHKANNHNQERCPDRLPHSTCRKFSFQVVDFLRPFFAQDKIPKAETKKFDSKIFGDQDAPVD
jgi:hypothetical protein